MKKIKLPLIIALLSISPSLIGAATHTVYANTSNIGPFEEHEKDSSFQVEVMSTYPYPIRTYEVIMFGNGDRVNDIATNMPTSVIGPYGKKKYSVTIPTSSLMDSKGMTITIKIHNDTEGKDEYNKKMKLYPVGGLVINPLNYNGKTYTPHKVSGLFGTTVSYNNEFFTFPSVYDYFNSSTYYKIDISQFQIKRESPLSLTNVGSGSLVIKNKNDYFPCITNKTDKSCKIDLNIVNNGEFISLAFKGPLYVEPQLLIMSDVPRSGFVQTSKFYMPINHINDINGTKFTFELSDIGLDKTTFRWDCSLSVSGNLLGRCSTSEYCVVGEVEE